MVLDRMIAAPTNPICNHGAVILVRNIALLMAGFFTAVRHVALSDHARRRVKFLD